MLVSKQEMFYSREMHSPYDSNWSGKMNVPQREMPMLFSGQEKAAYRASGQSRVFSRVPSNGTETSEKEAKNSVGETF